MQLFYRKYFLIRLNIYVVKILLLLTFILSSSQTLFIVNFYNNERISNRKCKNKKIIK